MSEKEQQGPAGIGDPELTDASRPGDPGQTAHSKKDSRRTSNTSDTQGKVERAQKCLENAALVSKRIKEHRRATAELLGKSFDDDESVDASSDLTSVSVRTGCSAATTDSTMTSLSVQDALKIPGISESLANTLKQKEILMEKIKQYKDIGKRAPAKTKKTFSMITSKVVEEGQSKTTALDADVSHLQSTIKEKDKTINIMQIKMKTMETTILDLQEKISEKDSVIEAKNKATSLMSDNLSKKDKDSVHLLEETRQQMLKMQENFATMEEEWKQEKSRLLNEISIKNEKIESLEEANSILENARFEISLVNSQISDDIEIKNKIIADLETQLQNISKEAMPQKELVEEEKGSQEISKMEEMTKRLEFLEQLNCQMKQTNFELENKLVSINTPAKTPDTPSPKKSSPQVTRKRGKSATRSTSKTKSPWASLAESSAPDDKTVVKGDTPVESLKTETVIQRLNKELLEKEFIISEKESVIKKQLEIISDKDEELNIYNKTKSNLVDVEINCDILSKTSEILQQGNIEVDVEELQAQLTECRNEITRLTEELETANRNMVKVKSGDKLKIKQLQKTIDNFSKMSDVNSEVFRLSEEVNNLQQRIAELEEDKGNLQLHLVDYDSGRLSETDLHRKLNELQCLSDARLKAIAVLETQKFDLVQELHILQQKNSELDDKIYDLQQQYSEYITMEMKSVQLEEQLDQEIAANKTLEALLDNVKLEKENCNKSIGELEIKNLELSNKLDIYVQENIDLSEKLQKLSAEKVSSAESIEMVESLTAQEKLELEEYNKQTKYHTAQLSEIKEIADEKENVESNESLIEISEESKELHKKIEMFTLERHEVMEKMSKLRSDNDDLNVELKDVISEKSSLENQIVAMKKEITQLTTFNKELSVQIESLKAEQAELIRESVIKRMPSEENEPMLKDTIDSAQIENTTIDERPQTSKVKPSKQMTKEILKLKNIIKEREAEIADCQMKILSLEENHQKLTDTIKNNTKTSENTMKVLSDENVKLKEELSSLKLKLNETSSSNQTDNDTLKNNIEQMQGIISEYSSIIAMRDARITELEIVLNDYENKISVYNNSLQTKENDISDYLNQISQLNIVSQKLKSTVELLEDEKSKDKNSELIKNLNVQIINLQSIVAEQDAKIKLIDEERNNISVIQNDLTEKNMSLEQKIQQLYNTLVETENRKHELEGMKNKYDEEIFKITNECKVRDEEIHEIKLQLRKESIENENLRQLNEGLDQEKNKYHAEVETIKKSQEDAVKFSDQKNDNIALLENKNKELMDKLKKFAANIKKKSSLSAELESKISTLESKISTLESELSQKQNTINSYENEIVLLKSNLQLLTSNETTLQNDKIKELEIQVLTLLQQKTCMAEQLNDIENNYTSTKKELSILQNENASINHKLQDTLNEVSKLTLLNDTLNLKVSEHEQHKENNIELSNKMTALEFDVQNKQQQIMHLSNEIERIQDEFNTIKSGFDAKIQEKELYIENIESENTFYRNRIARLEESISIMEDRRYSLERKADQLGTQLEEKQKAYCQYTSNEDELVNRLAFLMDHDQVVEKQLIEIEKDNIDLQNKVHHLIGENTKLLQQYTSVQEECLNLKENINRNAQEELQLALDRISQLESQIKNITHEHQIINKKQQEEIHNLETEFHIQIEDNIKEKKIISEKYEKSKEFVCYLEIELQKNIEHIKSLNSSLEEQTKLNLDMRQQMITANENKNSDYTDQYISEINKLQATINNNNSDIEEHLKYITECKNIISNLEHRLSSLQEELEYKSKNYNEMKTQFDIEKQSLLININQLKSHNTQPQEFVNEKDVQLMQNIEPHQKGSSQISDYFMPPDDNTKSLNLSLLQSQIVDSKQVDNSSNIKLTDIEHKIKNVNEIEDIIVPKKAYLCYDDSTKSQEKDPFCSEEGWSFGEKAIEYEDESSQTIAVSNMQNLVEENDKLKKDISNSNTKLAKALKKLKELKLSNEKLVNELKNSSGVNLLDSAIEDELKSQVDNLEKKLESVIVDLNKEKHEKDYICKQNEILKNANDRFLEIKEKLENELVIWKHNCKELNDKYSSFYCEENRDKKSSAGTNQDYKIAQPSAALQEVEKENDELNNLIETLQKENADLSKLNLKQREEMTSLSNEFSNLQNKIEQNKTLLAELELVQTQNTDFIALNSEQKNEIMSLSNKLSQTNGENEIFNKQIKSLNDENTSLKALVEQLNSNIEELNKDNKTLQQEKIVVQDDNSKPKSCVEEIISEAELMAANEKFKLLETSYATVKWELDDAYAKIQELKVKLIEASDNLLQHESKFSELNERSSKLNEENNNLLATVTELRSTISSAVDQRGFEVAEMWKQHLAQREADFQTIEKELRDQIHTLENKYESLLDSVQSSSQEETNKMIALEQLASMQAKVKDKEDHLVNLQSQYSEVVNEMESLRAEMADEKLIYENKLLNQQDENENQISIVKSNYDKEIMHKNTTVDTLNFELENLSETNHGLLIQVNDLTQSSEILKNRIGDLTNELTNKDIEVQNKLHEFNTVLSQRNEECENLRSQLVQYEKQIENLTFEKESDMAVLRLKLHEQTAEYESKNTYLQTENLELRQEIESKIQECTTLNKQIIYLNESLKEDSDKMSEMRSALESQELEIVNLKDELEKVTILLETSTAKIAKHVTFASDTKPGLDSESGNESEVLDVPKAELDLALYMLYQRDMRCEELTMELTSLLEERDTLQLRLSDCLRSYEELRSRCGSVSTETGEEVKESSSLDISTSATIPTTSLLSTTDAESLKSKLSELRTVRHGRDVRLRHDSERRDLDMRLLQRDVARLPPEAADQLRQAHSSIGHESQSTSTALMNWLMGKTTPKIRDNNISLGSTVTAG